MYNESDKVELKEYFIDRIKNEIIAFLNTNGGTIYVGVKDNGEIVGIQDDKKDEYDNTLSSWIREYFIQTLEDILFLIIIGIMY